MGFRESINGFFSLCNVGGCPYRITILGNSCIFLEGVEKILDLKPCVIKLKLKGKTLYFFGQDLTVLSFIEKDITISGKVEKIEWQD